MVTSDFLPKSFFEGKIHFSFFLQYLWRNTWNKNRGRHGGYLFFPSKSALVAKMHVNVSYSTFSLKHVVHLYKQLNCRFYFVINF